MDRELRELERGGADSTRARERRDGRPRWRPVRFVAVEGLGLMDAIGVPVWKTLFSNDGMNGLIEALLYNTLVSPYELERVETLLADKHGVTLRRTTPVDPARVSFSVGKSTATSPL